MIRNLKVLGLAVVAMVAMGVAASSASAEETWFQSETTPTTITGVQTGTNNFTFDNDIRVHCKVATFEGTTGVITTTITFSPLYENCTATPFGSATVHRNGCRYLIDSHGTVELVGCTNANKSIVITAPFCTIEITEEQNQELHEVWFDTLGEGTTKEINMTASIQNIRYHTSGFVCPAGKNTTGGKYEGVVVFTGENPTTKEHHGIWWSSDTK